jgi:hypothetical protein
MLNKMEAELVQCQRLHEALKEVDEGIHDLRFLEGKSPSEVDLSATHSARSELSIGIKALRAVCLSAKKAQCSLLTLGDLTLLEADLR